MDNQTVVAGSSPAEEVDVFGGQNPTLDEFTTYRKTGELPARFKPAEDAGTATDDAPEETAVTTEGDEEPPESDPDSEPEEDQEPPQKGSQKPKHTAEQRIAQLESTIEKIRRGAGIARKTDLAPVDQNPPQQPAPQYTRQKPTAEDKGTDGNLKYSTYEDFVEDLADWKSEQRIAQYTQEQAKQQALSALKVKMDDARSRYEDADDTIFPAAKMINEAQIPAAVKQMIADSEHFIDLCYVFGSDTDGAEKFIALAKSNPRAAIVQVVEYERGIREELAKTTEPSGKAPEPKRTSAPKPPAPVGGSSSRAFDVSDESLSPDDWMRKRNADIARKRQH